MFKRVTWFVTGAAAGVGGGMYAKKRVKQVVDRFAPEQVQQAAKDKARAAGSRVAEAVRDGRVAMREREQELRGERRAHPGAIDTTAHLPGPASAAENPIRRQQAAR